MDELRSRLAEWRSQELITIDQEEAIARHEGAAPSVATDFRLLEALSYIGAVLFLYGALIVAFDVGIPDDFFSDGDNLWGTFFLALGAAVALGAAAWMISARTTRPSIQRAVGLISLTAWIAFAVATLVLTIGIIDLGKGTTIVTGLAFLAVAFPAYRWRPGAPTQIALAIGSVATIAGLLVLFFGEAEVVGTAFGFDRETTLTLVAGVLYLAFGLGWMHLADRGRLVSRNLGYLLGGAAAFAGAQFFTGIARGWVIMVIGLGIFMLLSGIWKARSILMGIGTFITVLGFAQLLELVFEDSALSAGILMLILGAGALAAVIMRADIVTTHTPMPDAPTDPPSE